LFVVRGRSCSFYVWSFAALSSPSLTSYISDVPFDAPQNGCLGTRIA
jgi:hypothetical protein